MKSLVLTLLIVVLSCALGQAEKNTLKQQHLKDLAELKFKMDKLHQQLLDESNLKEAKNAKLFLRYFTIFYTRIEYNYEKLSMLYDLKVKVLKQYSETFLKERKLSSAINVESKFRVTKNDKLEYELNVQQVLLNRIKTAVAKEMARLTELIRDERDMSKRFELIEKFEKLKNQLKEVENLKTLEDIVLTESREFAEMNSGTIDYVRRKGSKLIRSFENMTNVDEINYFDDPQKGSERFDDETNITIALLHELSVLNSGETRIKVNMEKDGKTDLKRKLEDHINDMTWQISDIIKEVNLAVDWYKKPLNDAGKLYD